MSGGAAFTVDACLRVLKDTLDADRACALLADEFAGRRSLREEGFAPFDDVQDYVNLLGTAGAAGLTMGVVSLDATELRIMLRTASPSERRHAAVLLPLVEREPHHQVLVTLLLVNSFANEALPLFLDAIVPSWAAILFSVVAVLFFGEIIPSAFFTGRSSTASCPTRRPTPPATMVALVEVERELATTRRHALPFSEDEADLVRGAMALSKTSVGDVMVSAREVFPAPRLGGRWRDADASARARARVSRVPLYARGDPRDGAEYLLVRELVGVAASDAVRLVDLPGAVFPRSGRAGPEPLRPAQRVPDGRVAHGLRVRGPRGEPRARRRRRAPRGRRALVGIITLEDICEEILAGGDLRRDGPPGRGEEDLGLFRTQARGRRGAAPPPSRAPAARSPSAPIGALSFMAKGAQARRRLHRSASNPAPPPEQSRRGRSATAPTVTSPLVEASTWPPPGGATSVAPAPPLDP
ncbi:CNNM metal transporter [Aureococcus anophagefferens]|uniref:CNNM metal transporter n=1 Tax=Aureococcus anophagefferens TaxID=44056 RepID=A0ABR1FPS4_AURAN